MNQKTELIIKLLCIFILIILIISIILNGLKLDCNNCIVKFSATRPEYKQVFGGNMQEFEETMINLYTNLTQDKCVIKWENGYVKTK